MTPTLSPNTQAILLLTAPLIAGRGTSPRSSCRRANTSASPVTCGRYNASLRTSCRQMRQTSCGPASR
jgi:hypothetical protein